MIDMNNGMFCYTWSLMIWTLAWFSIWRIWCIINFRKHFPWTMMVMRWINFNMPCSFLLDTSDETHHPMNVIFNMAPKQKVFSVNHHFLGSNIGFTHQILEMFPPHFPHFFQRTHRGTSLGPPARFDVSSCSTREMCQLMWAEARKALKMFPKTSENRGSQGITNIRKC